MLYNFVILVGGLFALPKWLFQEKYKGSRRQRFGFCLPPSKKGTPRIWFHMVSMGETRAMTPIYAHLKAKHPNAVFYFSNTTKTGHEESKRRFEGSYFYLPLDLSWIMKKLVKRISPDLLILSESDFWLNQIRQVKERGGKVILLNGKISPRSAKRFAKLPLFSKKLFEAIDHLCIQNQENARRFQLLTSQSKFTNTGNLKLSVPISPLSHEERPKWQEKWNISETDTVMTVGSTHEGEEELLLSFLPKEAKILLVPRHPQRFAAVKKRFENDRVTVVDQMGVLSICYQLSDVAIVGGSFLPGVGGHNIFEPIQAKKPVIFGPYMETQKELTSIILEAEAGIQTCAHGLPKALLEIPNLQGNVEKLSALGNEALEKSLEVVEEHLLR